MPSLLAPLPPALDAPGRAEALAAICERHGVRSLALFGSATGERFDPAHSDVDVLFDFEPGAADLDNRFGLKGALETLFGREVDLVTPNGLENPFFRRQVLTDILPIYRSPSSKGLKPLRAQKLLWDAQRALDGAMRYASGRSSDDYHRDEMLRSAVERQLIIVGEALSVVRREAPESAARIEPLAKVVGMRNVLVHGYEGVDHHEVWVAVTEYAPALRQLLQAELARLGATA